MQLMFAIRQYIGLQQKLIEELRRSFSISASLDDWSTLITIPQKGVVKWKENNWRFKRHGNGIQFINEADKTVIDPHRKIESFPGGFDAWRLFLFLESKKIKQVETAGQVFKIDERSLEKALKNLEYNKKIICKNSEVGNLYEMRSTELKV